MVHTSHTWGSLPTETWSHIIGFLPSAHQKSLLNVSKLFHDISVRNVFGTVRIYLIDPETVDALLDKRDAHTEGEPQITAGRLAWRSWNILLHIIREPSFASIVKTMNVVALASGQATFELRGCISQSPWRSQLIDLQLHLNKPFWP